MLLYESLTNNHLQNNNFCKEIKEIISQIKSNKFIYNPTNFDKILKNLILYLLS